MAARGVQSRQGSMSTSPAPAAHNPTRVIGIERPLAAQVPHRPHVTPVRPQVPRIVGERALGQDVVRVDVQAMCMTWAITPAVTVAKLAKPVESLVFSPAKLSCCGLTCPP